MEDLSKSNPKKKGEVQGVVVEALPNAMFRVQTDDKIILTYLAGKMRLHKIKVLLGDKVSLELDQYGERGRIVKRF